MADLLFRCQECSLSLAVDLVYAGAPLACPGCAKQIDVPDPVIDLPCPVCWRQLATCSRYRGERFSCPACEAVVTVPDDITLRCRSCGAYVQMEEEYLKEFGGLVVDCPECRAELALPPEVVPRLEKVTQPPPDWASANTTAKEMGKTMKLDEILDYIPQSHLLEEGSCPYCKSRLYRLHDRAYVCKRCNRVIKTVRKKIR